MPVGVVIPVLESEPLFTITVNDYKDYQKVVEGTFQILDLDEPPASLFVNDEGKNLSFPMNRRATLLLWVHNPAFFQRDVIAGPALLIGAANAQGITQGVPDALYDLFFETPAYKAEVQTIGDPKWYGNQARYEDWITAYNAALSLQERWALAERVRVVAA